MTERRASPRRRAPANGGNAGGHDDEIGRVETHLGVTARAKLRGERARLCRPFALGARVRGHHGRALRRKDAPLRRSYRARRPRRAFPSNRAAPSHRTFSDASATSASKMEMIQKRTMILGSGQPFFSKWWWIGAIKNTRRPKSWNDAT